MVPIVSDRNCPFHDPHPAEHQKPGTNRRFLVKGLGSFSKGGGPHRVTNSSLKPLPIRGVFRKFICEHQHEKRQCSVTGTLGLAVMTLTQSGFGLLVSGSSPQLPRALNRLPESLPGPQQGGGMHIGNKKSFTQASS